MTQALTIGYNPDASDSIDLGLDVVAPPAPPAGNFDARITVPLSSTTLELYNDFRQTSNSASNYSISYAARAGNGPIVLNWDTADLPADFSLTITDDVTGNDFSLDMSTTNTLDTSTDPLLANGLRIVVQAGQNVFANVVGPTTPGLISDSCNFTVDVKIDMTNSPAPNDLLGSFTGTLSYDPAVLQFFANSEILSGYTGKCRC